MGFSLDLKKVKRFQEEVLDWWDCNARDLPWRRDPTPYKVLISEVMLQQTQVNRVIPKYHEFLDTFPDLECLASADTKTLLKVWSGLGYNRRAIWLREAANQIIERGNFPRSDTELRSLKGIGPYTSRSILIFAFNEDLAAVDTNIRRVFIASDFADEFTSEKELQEIAETLLPKGRSSDWHNALMDYGSSVLTSASTGIAPTSRQPKFDGSSRQIRGKVLQLLTESKSLDLDAIRSELKIDSCDQKDLMGILNGLISDELVERTSSGTYRIPT